MTHVRWRPFRLPLRHRFEAAHGPLEDREGVLVQIVDGDLRGTGEASPMPSLGAGTIADVVALLEEHGDALLDPARLEGLGREPGVLALRCALDVAALDLDARRKRVPVASLLAETPAPWVVSNAVISGASPDEVARFGNEALSSGYSVLKLKVGVGDVEEDLERIRALRKACPEATIRLDANGGWDEKTARRAIEALYPLAIELLEQPVPAEEIESFARIREFAPLRVAADESCRLELLDRILELRATDLLVLKPMMLGGVRPALELAQRAAMRGIGAFVTTTFDSSIGTAASLHLAAALPTDAAHGLATGEHLAADVVAETLRPRAGRMAVPAGAGLGIEVDDAALDAVATGPWREAAAGS